jgi:hypothetical protein
MSGHAHTNITGSGNKPVMHCNNSEGSETDVKEHCISTVGLWFGCAGQN